MKIYARRRRNVQRKVAGAKLFRKKFNTYGRFAQSVCEIRARERVVRTGLVKLGVGSVIHEKNCLNNRFTHTLR